ncbi:hypothetical protein TCAL_02596 [Tigriopus californicus]|uniref:Ornithine decarboxylase antizyme n=1 Tax=Tigriopus californicus TaxID=6832 RepID=A0A553ND14_TIGCA|nr:hypothetical protein TCAL_02596 [Tigriopus californicus]|eukprot:TCALIF_02596-PA protein Name:"Similar to Oda Ornithine decarboxylase antizyme (Aedes aegypti)" AED:0.03 eAED:0.03 QI:181/0.66/0.75/1/0.33/0.5/4/487/221
MRLKDIPLDPNPISVCSLPVFAFDDDHTTKKCEKMLKRNKQSLMISNSDMSANLLNMGNCKRGTGVGEYANPSDPASQLLEAGIGKIVTANGDDDPSSPTANIHPTLRLRFYPSSSSITCSPCAGPKTIPPWDAILWQGRLYVNMTAQQLSEGSKEAFVSMLEYAEETLKCSDVIICLSGGNVAKSMIKNFLFLGFQPLTPGHELLPPMMNDNMVCFVYNI